MCSRWGVMKRKVQRTLNVRCTDDLLDRAVAD
jgi:hypothetical protein